MEKNIDKNQSPPYLKVEDIYKSFGANKVLKGISFDLSKGQVLAIIGSSGSGKTTLLRCITFLERADRGVLTVGDNVLFDMSKVKTEDGTLSSSLSSPLCTKVRYLKAKALYVKSVTGPLARFEYGEKREYSLPVSENTEDFAEFLRIPFISRPLRKAAEEIYISRRRSELIAESLERDKQRAMRAEAAPREKLQPEKIIRQELRQISAQAKERSEKLFSQSDAKAYADVLSIKDVPDGILRRARKRYVECGGSDEGKAISSQEAKANMAQFKRLRKEGAAELKKMNSAAYIRSKRLHFGLVFQSFNLFPQYSVLDNVTLAPRLMIKEELKMLSLFAKAEKCEREGDLAGAAKKRAKAEIIAETLAKEDVEAARRTARECAASGGRPDKHEYAARRRGEIERYAYTLLEQVGLADKVRAYPCELSGGQCQRVAIARALALRPNILCFDEPTSALDPELTGEVLKVIKGLKSSERTMIVVTHEMDFARDVADKVLFMAGGVVEEEGTPEKVFDHPESEITKAFLRKSEEKF